MQTSRRTFLWAASGSIAALATLQKKNSLMPVAVIGLGQRGESYLRCAAERLGIQALAICDTSTTRLDEGVRLLGKSNFGCTLQTRDYRSLLRESSIPSFLVTSSAPSAFQITRDALDAGKAVLLDSSGAFRDSRTPRFLKNLEGMGAPVYVGGFHPLWARLTFSEFLRYARRRGADRLTMHASLPEAKVADRVASAFDLLEAVGRTGASPTLTFKLKREEASHFRMTETVPRPDAWDLIDLSQEHPIKPSRKPACGYQIEACGNGVSFQAEAYWLEEERDGNSICEDGILTAFKTFQKMTVAERNTETRLQRTALELAQALIIS